MIQGSPLAIAAATDGACSGNPGPGGWAGLIRFEDGSIQEFGGREELTTNNRMELEAAIRTFEKLKNIKRHPDLIIKTDSKYLLNGLHEWIKKWKKKGWVTSSGKPVLNQDLWEALEKVQLKDVKMEYVKGHSGDKDNERVDKIAVSFSKNISIKLATSSKSYSDASCQELISHKPKPKDKKIEKLLSKLDLAMIFAQKGYWLKLDELSELTDIPIKDLLLKKKAWKWRQWVINPITDELWQIKNQANINE